jgi:hypothetical protein
LHAGRAETSATVAAATLLVFNKFASFIRLMQRSQYEAGYQEYDEHRQQISDQILQYYVDWHIVKIAVAFRVRSMYDQIGGRRPQHQTNEPQNRHCERGVRDD